MIGRARVDVTIDGCWAVVALVAVGCEGSTSALRVRCATICRSISLN